MRSGALAVMLAIFLSSQCNATTIDNPTTASQYIASVSEQARPAWLRLTPGRRAILTGDEAPTHDTSEATVCGTLDVITNALMNGSHPSPEDCPPRSAGQVVIFHSLHCVNIEGTSRKDFEANISSLDGSWSGYVSINQIKPIPPLHTKLRAVSVDVFVDPYKEPRLSNAQYTHEGPADTAPPPGLPISNIPIELLRYDPVAYDQNAVAHQVFVKVLAGKYAGRTGWLDSIYVETMSGYPLGCFCQKW